MLAGGLSKVPVGSLEPCSSLDVGFELGTGMAFGPGSETGSNLVEDVGIPVEPLVSSMLVGFGKYFGTSLNLVVFGILSGSNFGNYLN